jgi:plasmid segregation protein ParM
MEQNTIEINVVVGNDNGNSEHDIIINGEVINQPNVLSKIRHIPNLDEVNPKFVTDNIESNLIVSVISPSATTGNYYIGDYAIKSGEKVRSIEIGVDNDKVTSEIIVINTLSQIAGYAVKEVYKQDNRLESNIKVKADMATSLPMSQYSKAAAESFVKKFTSDKHQLKVFVGKLTVNVEIEFVYVKVIPEGVTAVHALQACKNELLNDFNTKYELKIDGSYFQGKRVFHIAIGEGTTEYPVTEGLNFVPNAKDGSDNGVGHAINKSLDEFRQKIGVRKYSRQAYSHVLRDENHKYNDIAVDIICDYMEEESDEILEKAKNKLQSIANEADVVAVYGGGSIPMKEYLEQKLDTICTRADIKLLYVPEKFAVNLEAEGLYEFAKSDIFKALKEKAVNK